MPVPAALSFEKIVHLIITLGRKPLNAVKEQYRPHMTLAFFYPEDAEKFTLPVVLPKFLKNTGMFKVSLGLSDMNWQFNTILFDCLFESPECRALF